MSFRTNLVLCLSAYAVLGYAAGEVVLKWVPIAGHKAVYKAALSFKSGDTDFEVGGTVTEDTVSVDADKVVTKTTGEMSLLEPNTGKEVEFPYRADTCVSRGCYALRALSP